MFVCSAEETVTYKPISCRLLRESYLLVPDFHYPNYLHVICGFLATSTQNLSAK
jgi:hypothetical protein